MVRHAECWVSSTLDPDLNAMDVWEIVSHLLRSYHQVTVGFIIGVSTSKKNIDVLFDAIFRKCASMSSDVSVRNIDVF